jgi:translation initiation factor IF-2
VAITELKANPSPWDIVESEKGRIADDGPLIVQRGTLRVGEAIVAGASWGRIKAMFNHLGEKITEAGPSTPVEVMGIGTVPRAGDTFAVFSDEREARDLAESRLRERDAAESGKTLSLEAISGDIAAGRIKDLNIIIKGDTHGSVEAINTSLLKLGAEDVRVNVIHTAAGNITESDVMLATASRAIVLGFHVKVDPGARRVAATERIDIRLYQIIYELIEDVEKAVKGLMQPVIVEVIDGHAEIRAVFRVRGGRVAGCMITDGAVRRNSLARVLRKGEMVHESRVSSLKRFQEDVREVTTGLECGIGTERFDSFAEGDVIEAFHVEERG